MKRFHSSATRLLQIARQQQRLCELLLARAQAADAAVARRLADAEEECRAAEHGLADVLAAGGGADVLQSQQQYLIAATELRRRRKTERDLTSQKVAEALTALRTQQSRARSLERLEQRDHDEFRRDLFREQEAQQDEQRVRRHWLEQPQARQVQHG